MRISFTISNTYTQNILRNPNHYKLKKNTLLTRIYICYSQNSSHNMLRLDKLTWFRCILFAVLLFVKRCKFLEEADLLTSINMDIPFFSSISEPGSSDTHWTSSLQSIVRSTLMSELCRNVRASRFYFLSAGLRVRVTSNQRQRTHHFRYITGSKPIFSAFKTPQSINSLKSL